MLNWSQKQFNPVAVLRSFAVFCALLILGIIFLKQINSVIMLLFLSFILMVALNPGVNKIQKFFHLPRIMSIVLVYFLFITLLTIATAFLLPPLISQIYQLVKLIDLPIIQNEVATLKFSLAEMTDLMNRYGGSVSVVYKFISSTFSGIFTLFSLLVMSFYLILDRPVLHTKMNWFTDKKAHVELTKTFLDQVEQQLGGWVRGQSILMLVIGVFTYAGLSILNAPYALPLALLAGLMEVVPNLGPTLSAIPAIAIAYLDISPVMGLIVFCFYVIVQQLENNFIVPKILRDNADVNPLVAIVSMMIGFKIYGIMGGLLAVPVYIVLRTAYSQWSQHHRRKLLD